MINTQRVLQVIVFCSQFSVKEKLAHDPESEVATTSLRVSLMCPVCVWIIFYYY